MYGTTQKDDAKKKNNPIDEENLKTKLRLNAYNTKIKAIVSRNNITVRKFKRIFLKVSMNEDGILVFLSAINSNVNVESIKKIK